MKPDFKTHSSKSFKEVGTLETIIRELVKRGYSIEFSNDAKDIIHIGINGKPHIRFSNGEKSCSFAYFK